MSILRNLVHHPGSSRLVFSRDLSIRLHRSSRSTKENHVKCSWRETRRRRRSL